MSMISEQVADLREKAQIFEDSGCATNGIVKTFREAADTIEELSAKLADVNMERSTAYYNDGWIPCSMLPPRGKKVLIHMAEDFYDTAWFDGYNFRTKEFFTTVENVIAWKYIEPYKGVE